MSARRLPVAVVLLGLVTGFAHAALTTEVPPACHSVDVSESSGVTDDYLAILFSEGYTGDPRDGQERIYAPNCPNATTAALLIEHRNR